MSDKFPKIVFIGMPDMAVICLNRLITDGHNVVAVILPDKDNQGRRLLKTIADNSNIQVFEYEKTPNEAGFADKIKALGADVGVICSFNHKLSKEFLYTTKIGYINCHPSHLPYYRGANPYFHIINNGEKESAITLHFADEEYDTGNIIAQETYILSKKETMGMLFSRTNFMMAKMLSDVLTKYAENGKIASSPQPKGIFPEAPNVLNDFYINWSDGVINTDRLIRAANPFYNVMTHFRGGTIRIISGECRIEKHSRPYGEISIIRGEKMKIAAGEGFYLPKVIQAGNWGFYEIADFIENFAPKQGEILQ